MKLVRSMLAALYRWLDVGHPVAPADLIFVLAGRHVRKSFGLGLFQQGIAPRLLLSVARFEIRRFASLALPCPVDLVVAAARVPAPERHFFVTFADSASSVMLVRRGRFGTLSEIAAFRYWLAAHPGIRLVAVVSGAPHLRRIRLCCRALLPSSIAVRFLSVPDEAPGLVPDCWWKHRYAARFVLSELAKVGVYMLVLPFYARRGAP